MSILGGVLFFLALPGAALLLIHSIRELIRDIHGFR